MNGTFDALTTEQKARVESLEIAEHSLLQLANDMNDTMLNSYCKANMSVIIKARLKQMTVDVLMERERLLGEIESIKRG